jgi:ATP-dependent Clp protease adaptor protein ClpS
MSDKNTQSSTENTPDSDQSQGGTATKAKPSRKPAPARKPPQMLPPWKVLLHNDDQNDMQFVVQAIVSLTPLNLEAAAVRTLEAHQSGLALLLTTHKERAELYQEQFQSKGLTVTIEPAE